jgi:anti-anti-sigma factor
MMAIKLKNKHGVCRIKPEGEMTIYTAAGMKESLLSALQKCNTLEIDLAKVGEMDSAGFQLLLLLKREADNQGKSLRLSNHSQAALEVLNLFQMAGHFG